jgi:uncharacterized protein YjbI with pentapeptide repeats
MSSSRHVSIWKPCWSHTVIRAITAHLQKKVATSWQGLDFDFTGVVFDGGDFNGARFSGGTVNFHGARFSGGTVDFRGAEFSGGKVEFDRADFSGGEVDFSDPRDWSVPPELPWKDTPPAGVKLPPRGAA